MSFIAIDPGLKGALALFSDQGQVIEVKPMPVFKSEGKVKQDNSSLVKLLQRWKTLNTNLEAILEEPLVFHNKKGVYSVGTTLRNVGRIEGILFVLGITVHTVTPKQWQAFYSKTTPLKTLQSWKLDATKQQSITHASQLFPKVSLLTSSRCRKPSDGIADALLIGHFWAERGYNRN